MDSRQAESVRAYLRQRLPDNLQLLERMVGINSYTANAAGVNTLGRLTADAFAGLGFEATFVPSPGSAWGQHLILERPGRSTRTMVLVSHLDTVYPPEEERDHGFNWQVEGPRIYGPGVGDIKGGTIMMRMVLEALARRDPEALNAARWVIGFNAAEECLDPHFSEILKERAGADVIAALVFEGTPPNDAGGCPLVVARKGRIDFKVAVTGRGAHAGGEIHRGVNAVVHAAHLIEAVAALNDPACERSVNVAVVHGGNATNRVPHSASFSGEMRAFDQAVMEDAMRDIEAILAEARTHARNGMPGYALEITASLQAWPHNPATDALLEQWRAVGSAVGEPVQEVVRGGLSDGSLLWSEYPTLDGLGPSGTNYHCSEHDPENGKEAEYILPASFVPKALVHVGAIRRLIAS